MVVLVLVAEATHGPDVFVVVAHGWNIDEELLVAWCLLVRLVSALAWAWVGTGTWGRPVACRAHCWVLRQPAVGRGFLGGTGHRVVVIPAGLLVVVSAGCLVGSSVA